MQVQYNPGLGAEGATDGRLASAVIDATTEVTIDFATAFSLVERAAATTPAVVNLTEILGNPPQLRYILIQPQGGSVEVRLGNQPAGIRVADGERYAIPGTSCDVTFDDGPATVHVEVAW